MVENFRLVESSLTNRICTQRVRQDFSSCCQHGITERNSSSINPRLIGKIPESYLRIEDTASGRVIRNIASRSRVIFSRRLFALQKASSDVFSRKEFNLRMTSVVTSDPTHVASCANHVSDLTGHSGTVVSVDRGRAVVER